MKTPLYNVAHPLAESGKPIFIPFGEWNYDGQSRQRLDRAHGEKIANELNARVAKGDPGIPVYQGHPDVPALASKYPDKGALGWITRIELVNESPDGRAVPGLALTVEWDRDPGRGFRWFSPYWLANSRDGGTYIVDEIASIGLVNNPNIPEFRLANEVQPMKKKLNPAIIELAAKYDRLANEWDESKHPREEDGKFAPAGAATGIYSVDDWNKQFAEHRSNRSFWRKTEGPNEVLERLRHHTVSYRSRAAELRKSGSRGDKYMNGKFEADYLAQDRINNRESIVRVHKAAILAGYTYNPQTHQYEERDRLANEANFDESKHPRSEDGKFSSGGSGGSGSKESGSEKSSDSQPEAKTRLRKMVKSEAVSVDAGGRPTKDDVVFEYQHKMYFVGKDKESTVQEFVDRGLVKRVRGYHTMFEGDDGRGLSRNAFILKERGAMSSLAKELAARFDAARKAQ